ncbi:ABC transporter substrate-binding protein [Jiella sp. MQZ9-1]|uniref:ABC transporter substrate-binding protein n=1 Tax=Jiella flava TaxID=2816857 RepID=A0A939FYM7_9HYPH|nr:ABC transporter substrate-binding protein [Jiella flava]MBO0662413.1 ABC transporter substrate-binding protein [Jiella flava]MCD2471637.1 ABC transporter substrate-binding protein [Jiella flava]
MKHFLASSVIATALLGLAPAAQAQDSCNVTISNMNWASAEVMANIDKIVLKEGYGCDVTLVPGDTMPTFSSMTEKQEPDVAPEMWVNQFREQIDKAADEKRVFFASEVLKDGGEEGFWIPKYMAEAHPEIKTVEDAFSHPELFPSKEDPSKGAFYNCPAGWGCQITSANLFKAYKAGEKGFVLVDTGSAAGLDGSIANAYEKKEPWFGYYWAPTAILGKYPMVKLDFGVKYDAKEWQSCTTVADCADPKKNAWTKSEVYTIVTPKIEKMTNGVKEYFDTRSWHNETVNKLLAWKEDNQATGEDTAYHFLENNADIWTKWVSPEAAKKIKGAL